MISTFRTSGTAGTILIAEDADMSFVPFAPTDAEILQLLPLFAKMHQQTGIHLDTVVSLVEGLAGVSDADDLAKIMVVLSTEVVKAREAHMESFNLIRKINASRRSGLDDHRG
jgi:hypothetical protein